MASSMFFASRGTGVLVMGVGALLLSGVMYAGMEAMRTRAPVASLSSISVGLFETQGITYPSGSYAELIPSIASSTVGRDQSWRIEASSVSGNCALLSERPNPLMVGVVSSTRCNVLGASIEGRYVHLATGVSDSCLDPLFCEMRPFSIWTIYDARTAMMRPVPKPVREGTWQAVDAVRSVGLFRGVIRSTRSPSDQQDWWALTDVGGTPFWNGSKEEIDARAQEIVPLRILSRPNGDLLLAYLAIDEERHAEERLALFTGRVWHTVLFANPIAQTWRLEMWESGARGGQASLRWMDASSKQRQTLVSTN